MVVDSSGWIEFLLGDDGAANFRPAIIDVDNLIVPAIAIFEVARLILRTRTEEQARSAVAYMSLGRVEPLDVQLGSEAAILSVEYRLPMADSIIYATAQRFDAELWTQDVDFDGLPGVRYFPKLSRP
ncbi:MAG: type II toxin-antitoxin system VapC family toxin [Sandarakinorhabdus sp.]|nr:type II toxin-antitoxin system VapC family toxin [Sandarakinorhabdus sp.]